MTSRPPHPALAGAVHRYVGYVERSCTPVIRREVPQDQVTVILGFGAPLTIGGQDLPAQGRGSFVAPLNDAYAITEFTGVSHGIQIDLSPQAARAWFGVPMRELDALVVDLEDLLGVSSPRLVEQLHEAPSWDARFVTFVQDARRATPYRASHAKGHLPDSQVPRRPRRDRLARASVWLRADQRP